MNEYLNPKPKFKVWDSLPIIGYVTYHLRNFDQDIRPQEGYSMSAKAKNNLFLAYQVLLTTALICAPSVTSNAQTIESLLN